MGQQYKKSEKLLTEHLVEGLKVSEMGSLSLLLIRIKGA